MLRSGLAAEQGHTLLEVDAAKCLVDLPLRHEPEELVFVVLPSAFALLVCVEHVLSRSEQGLVLIGCSDKLSQEVRQIRCLGESGELRGVVEPDVEKSL